MRVRRWRRRRAEADAWEYGADGNIRIAGTDLTVPARSQEAQVEHGLTRDVGVFEPLRWDGEPGHKLAAVPRRQ